LVAGPTASGDLLTEIAPLVISAPFGNYVQHPGTTPTLGTYTWQRRGGRIAAMGRAALTVRYYRRLGAWVNRIGLRNPGIHSLDHQIPGARPIAESIVSVHGFSPEDWFQLLSVTAAARPAAIELNISCPNVGEISWPPELFSEAVATGIPIIVKIPPVRYAQLATDAFSGGVRHIHAVNTLPVRGGGMSGAPLKPIGLSVVQRLRDEFGPELGIIAGGGIRTAADVHEYAQAGADRFAIGTLAMRPSAPFSEKFLAEVRRAASDAVSGSTGRVPTPLPRD